VRFWDSSALVPLVVRQPASAQVEGWLGDDRSVVTWTLTPVELVSALRRLVREGALPERAARDAEEVTAELVGRVHVVADVERVKAIATRLLRVHTLRAGDALQLAAALVWTDGHPDRAVLHTFDRRLADAAAREGFRVIPTA
jgi:predicted nucleic acid-binding protein